MGIRIICVAIIAWLAMPFASHAFDARINIHQDFLQAENNLNRRHYSTFKRQLSALNHPLKPYLEARYIRRLFYKAPTSQIDAFLSDHKNTPEAKRLRRSWLYYLAKQADWERYLAYYQPNSRLALRCHYTHALHQSKQEFKAITEGQQLWLIGDPLPKACDKVFAHWKRSGLLSQDLIWQRFLKAVDHRHYRLARYLQKLLTGPLKDHAKMVKSLWQRPWQILTNETVHQLPLDARFLLAMRTAKRQGQPIESNHPILQRFSETQLKAIEQEHLRNIADSGDQDAFKWYQKAASSKQLTTELEEAFLMGAIKHGNWSIYNHLFKLGSPSITSDSQWQYWQGRSLQLMGAHDSSSAQYFRQAAKSRNYYGFMASQQLDQQASMNHQSIDIAASDIQRARLDSGIKRALALLDLARIPQARREWQHAMENQSKEGKLAMALIAGRHNWSDRAIMTLANLKNWHDLQLRFPLAHLEIFKAASQKNQISQNWIYGIARQESAFMHDVKSAAGATGLMQLMPATARGISRQLSVRYSHRKLIVPEYNVNLGSGYLKKLSQRFNNNKVLATAAYNAGPTNVKRWLKRHQGPIDQWIENIPFRETRSYVKRVLTYSVIYSYRLGQQEPILDYETLASWGVIGDSMRIAHLKSRQKKQG